MCSHSDRFGWFGSGLCDSTVSGLGRSFLFGRLLPQEVSIHTMLTIISFAITAIDLLIRLARWVQRCGWSLAAYGALKISGCATYLKGLLRRPPMNPPRPPLHIKSTPASCIENTEFPIQNGDISMHRPGQAASYQHPAPKVMNQVHQVRIN